MVLAIAKMGNVLRPQKQEILVKIALKKEPLKSPNTRPIHTIYDPIASKNDPIKTALDYLYQF